jgi:hypothetical protein
MGVFEKDLVVEYFRQSFCQSGFANAYRAFDGNVARGFPTF